MMSEVKKPSKEFIDKWQETYGWQSRQYPFWKDQLDMLWDDIDSGKFGAEAKKGKFYKEIKKIKDDKPKPDNFEELKKELKDIVKALENA